MIGACKLISLWRILLINKTPFMYLFQYIFIINPKCYTATALSHLTNCRSTPPVASRSYIAYRNTQWRPIVEHLLVLVGPQSGAETWYRQARSVIGECLFSFVLAGTWIDNCDRQWVSWMRLWVILWWMWDSEKWIKKNMETYPLLLFDLRHLVR